MVRSETITRPDVLRFAPPFKGEPGPDSAQFWADYNSSKLGLGLNLAAPGGREVGLALAEWADVVIEAFTPGVMARFGLAYEDLVAVHPDLIMLSTCMNGQDGPRATFAGYGTVMAPMSGFSNLTGWPDRAPSTPYGAYTDFVCQRICATALIAAIDHHRRTGEGQHLDVAQYEGALQFLAPWLLDVELNGRLAERDGNRSPWAAPHGVFRCLDGAWPEGGGEGVRERWVAIAAETEGQWDALRAAIRMPELDDPRFASLAARKANEDELETIVAAFTATRTREEVVALLQPDVVAAPVNDPYDLLEDPQLLHRGYLVELEHTVMGPVRYQGPEATLSATPMTLSKAAPALGEDTRHVLGELLGYSESEIDELVAAGTVEVFAP
ncbi:hypothetical protein GCM10022287_16010 [Gryllotalpicola koreensis]|uniref:CoA transferase n=1 Tax=Gryllotalpicola koreensis TaxID=993086 RepID=A0ABP7ZYJ9_9MICO